MTPHRPTIARLCFVLLVGCGATTPDAAPPPEPSGPFTAEDDRVFENGLDLVGEPDLLEGPWLEQWEVDLDRRVTSADVVALGTIQSVHLIQDLEREQRYRLVASVDRTYLGAERPSLDLLVAEDEDGYDSVDDNQGRAMSSQFFVFARYQQLDDGTVATRWHMSPATDQVASRVLNLLRTRRDVTNGDGTRRRVIRRPN